MRKVDDNAIDGLRELARALMVWGERGAAWFDVCNYLGVTVKYSFGFLYGNPPRSRKMRRVVRRFRTLRRVAMTEALRRVRLNATR